MESVYISMDPSRKPRRIASVREYCYLYSSLYSFEVPKIFGKLEVVEQCVYFAIQEGLKRFNDKMKFIFYRCKYTIVFCDNKALRLKRIPSGISVVGDLILQPMGLDYDQNEKNCCRSIKVEHFKNNSISSVPSKPRNDRFA